MNEKIVRLIHAMTGMLTEAGEVADTIKKHIFYGKPLDEKNITEELGDLLWYVALACNTLEINLNDVMEANIAKLKARFPDRYTDHHAAEENRDRGAEAAAMIHLARTREDECQHCNGYDTHLGSAGDRENPTCRQCLGTGKITVCVENYHDGIEGVK